MTGYNRQSHVGRITCDLIAMCLAPGNDMLRKIGEHPMKSLRIAAMIGLVAWSACAGSACAWAQMPNINLMPDDPTKTPEQKEQEQQRDQA